MSISPFDSFQSRFVTYLLNFPRITIPVHFVTAGSMKQVQSLIIQNMIATFSLDNWDPIFHPAHKVKFEVDPNYKLFPNIFY